MIGDRDAKQLITVEKVDGEVYLSAINLCESPVEEEIIVLTMEDVPGLIVRLREVYDDYQSTTKGDAQ